MAHYAEIENGIVKQVVVIDNSWDAVKTGLFLQSLSNNQWIQTSFNSKIRGHFAGIGDRYDSEKDIFIAPKPFDSWILEEKTGSYISPKPMPDDGNSYKWNEIEGNWNVLRRN